MERYITVTATHPISDMFLMDVLTTAVEGGIGYWSGVRDMERDDDLNVKWVELELLENGSVFRVTLDTVHRGLQCLIDRDLRDVDLDDIDAGAADAIVQLGLFHTVVYG